MALEIGVCIWATSVHHFPNICDLSGSGQRNERQSSSVSEKQVQEGREAMQFSLHCSGCGLLRMLFELAVAAFVNGFPFRCPA